MLNKCYLRLGCCEELLSNQQTNIPIACENLKILLLKPLSFDIMSVEGDRMHMAPVLAIK